MSNLAEECEAQQTLLVSRQQATSVLATESKDFKKSAFHFCHEN